jgi:hypothetical protein
VPPNCGACDGGGSLQRTAISNAVFFKTFFLNTDAIINHGISLLQTLHQRRY